MAIALSSTSPELFSITGFYAIQWVFFGLCVVAFATRSYIRWVCFRRLLAEDYLMVVALACHLGIAVLGQLYMADIYELTAAEHGGAIGASFFTDTLQGLKAFGSTSVLSLVGIWLVKFNFLFFFYRLGHQVRKYRIFWWIVFVFCVGCGAACLGLLQYPCMFGDIETIFVQCDTFAALKSTYARVIMTSVLDVLSDVALLCFPISILWRVKVTIRKKILLSAVFGLVGFTIAVTIVRGSIFGGVYKSLNEGGNQEMNISWIWFWFYVEFTVSYIIACIVSFRTLFIHKEQQQAKTKAADLVRQQQQQQQNEKSSGARQKFLERMRQMHDSVLDTCRTWEHGGSVDVLRSDVSEESGYAYW